MPRGIRQKYTVLQTCLGDFSFSPKTDIMHNRPFLRSTAAILAFSLNEWSPACASLTSAPAHARHSTSAAHEDLLWMRSGSPHRLPSPHRRKKQPSNTSPWLKVAVKARGGGGSGRQVSRGNHQQQQPAAASTSSIRRSAKVTCCSSIIRYPLVTIFAGVPETYK